MALVEELADKLSADTMEAMIALGDDRFYEQVAKVIAASSPSFEEAFLTSMRIRLAEQRARKFLDGTLDKALKEAQGKAGG